VFQVDLGFRPGGAASIKVDYDDSAPAEEASVAKRTAIFQRILADVSALPGVQAAGMADYLPLGPNREWDSPVPAGKTFAPNELPDPLVYVITPGFIRAMGIRLHGREFTWRDGPHSERVVPINASAARIYWPNEDAIGKILLRGDEQDRVVGVVDDVHEENVESGPGSQIYYPVTQQGPNGAQLVVRSSLPPSVLDPTVLRTLRELNPGKKRRALRIKPGDQLEYVVEGDHAIIRVHLGTRSLKGALASRKGKGMSFAQIRDAAARAARSREGSR
jgi:hypothetical protein